ncbi:hypothetical protein WAX74_03675 [Psychrobacillus sp. FJAT-51614]|uniref:Uncharacterized protein n=1 Tax=Psychrobacillus mangrovi TaxID=3117745 RepID=A0ABU8F175_9BACI
MKKLSIIFIIVLAVVLYPNAGTENAAKVKEPITTLDLPLIF